MIIGPIGGFKERVIYSVLLSSRHGDPGFVFPYSHLTRLLPSYCRAAAYIMQSINFLLAALAVWLVVRAELEGAWCYDSQDPKCGPTHWQEMASACGGPAQSPINIDLHLVQRDPTLGPFIFQGYDSAPPGPWTLENNGHTALLHVDTGLQGRLEMRGAGLPPPSYRALQLHFHWGTPASAGSEHSLDGQRSSMEMHVVHMNTRYRSMQEALGHPDGLAVLAVLLTEQDADNANFSVLVSGLKNVSGLGLSAKLASTFPLASVLPSSADLAPYYRYPGSLTTPGCQPAVLWTVFEDPVAIGRAQVVQFQTLLQAGSQPVPLTNNFRPQQPLRGRRVVASPGASVRSAARASMGPAPLVAALLGLELSQQLWQGL
ncbi:PREDICTED: carbonic anhydrase 15-like [Chrysochloris asiatica]|uniref:carbonic anhydrase n=1 Tax=Chrysochloris asiatica TaxID=185453 RepID=A0A9B0U0M2_CHRAS|nr:PREDICTED: carbonic anhydrase 15-like [Chrysochloris asiatica]